MDHLDFDALWNFDDPAATEAQFRRVRAQVAAEGDSARLLELDTQIARTQGLQRRFDDAFATLAAVQAALPPDAHRAKSRYEMELGRALRSSGKPTEAAPHFDAAALVAQQAGEDALCIDAIHMQALVEPDVEKQIAFNMAALRIAQAAADPKAQRWQASLLNNQETSLPQLSI